MCANRTSLNVRHLIIAQTKYSPRQIQFVVWYLERTIDLMGPDVEVRLHTMAGEQFS